MVAAFASLAQTVDPQKVIRAIEGDFNRDGRIDRAVLMEDADSGGATFVIFVGNGGGKFRSVKLPLSFYGAPELLDLRVTKAGSLEISEGHFGGGRYAWERTLTLSYRKGQFLISGFTSSSFDRLDPESSYASCNVNLLTGKGKVRGEKISVKAGGIPMDQWSGPPAECQ